MGDRMRVTEGLDIDLKKELWCCNRCGREITSARQNYKEGCLVRERSPHEVYRPILPGDYTLAPDPDWVRIVEFYCPGCGLMFENELIPPGHPLTHEIELDIDDLKARATGQPGRSGA